MSSSETNSKGNDKQNKNNNESTEDVLHQNSEDAKSSKALLEALEEDDVFEEFEPEHWAEAEQHGELQQQWVDNWDDDMEDDFTQHLRQELSAQGNYNDK